MSSTVTLTEIPETTVVRFDGFRPDPEAAADASMRSWFSQHPDVETRGRILGHNIDREGRPAHDIHNEGYRIEVELRPELLPAIDDAPVGTIEEGRFATMVIEGSFDNDPQGTWITDGWGRLAEEMELRGLHRHPSGRWYEEWLPPTTTGTVRLGLLAEVS